jgi:hypothetical protein
VRNFFMSIVLALFCVKGLAGTCGSNLCTAQVKNLYPHENGSIYVEADADMSPLDCTRNQGQFMVLENSNPLRSEIYSMLLAAHMANKEVTMRIANGSSNCRVVYTQLRL